MRLRLQALVEELRSAASGDGPLAGAPPDRSALARAVWASALRHAPLSVVHLEVLSGSSAQRWRLGLAATGEPPPEGRPLPEGCLDRPHTTVSVSYPSFNLIEASLRVNWAPEGCTPDNPWSVRWESGRLTSRWWLGGRDVSPTVEMPARTLADAASWPMPLSDLAGPHPLAAEIAAAAEAEGFPVCSISHTVPGITLFSPGGGAPYRAILRPDCRVVRNKVRMADRRLLHLHTDLDLGICTITRTIGGLVDGATEGLPGICRIHPPVGGEAAAVERSYFRAGVALAAPEDVPPAPSPAV